MSSPKFQCYTLKVVLEDGIKLCVDVQAPTVKQ